MAYQPVEEPTEATKKTKIPAKNYEVRLSPGEQAAKIKAIAAKAIKDAKGGRPRAMNGRMVPRAIRIPSGLLRFDYLTGGGVPLGKIVEVYGEKSSGKTTLCLTIMAEFQKQGLIVAYIDIEKSFDPDYAERLGVDLDSLLFYSPNTGEEAIEDIEQAVKDGASLAVIDSVATMLPSVEEAGEVGASHIGRHARLMGQAMRRLIPRFQSAGCTGIFINQLRTKVGASKYEPQYVTTGGKALEYAAAMQFHVAGSSRKVQGTGDDKETLYRETTITEDKNKTTAGDRRRIRVHMLPGEGFDLVHDIVDSAIRYGAVTKTGGAWLEFDGERFNGMAKFEDWVRTNMAAVPRLQTATAERIQQIVQDERKGTRVNFEDAEVDDEGASVFGAEPGPVFTPTAPDSAPKRS